MPKTQNKKNKKEKKDENKNTEESFTLMKDAKAYSK